MVPDTVQACASLVSDHWLRCFFGHFHIHHFYVEIDVRPSFDYDSMPSNRFLLFLHGGPLHEFVGPLRLLFNLLSLLRPSNGSLTSNVLSTIDFTSLS